MSADELRTALALYDGKHTDVLERIAADHPEGAPFVRALLSLAKDGDPRVRSAAIWLLRHRHRNGARFTPAQARAILRLLLTADHWEPRLNLLQIVDTLPVAPADWTPLLKSLESFAQDDNGFVRAWAYSALHTHSRSDARRRARVDAMIAEAAKSETPAVRARLRQVLKAPGR